MIKTVKVLGIHEASESISKGEQFSAIVQVYDPDSIVDCINLQNQVIRSGCKKCSFGVYPMRDTMEQEIEQAPVVSAERFERFLKDAEEHPHHPSISRVESLIKCLRKLIEDQAEHEVLVHCYAGISRSAATAILLHHLMGHTEEDAINAVFKIRRCMWPSSLILRIADRILGTKFHELIVKWKEEEMERPFSTISKFYND